MFVQATVREESTLLDFVHSNLGPSFPQWFSKKVARFRIGDGLVQVNGVPERFLHLQLQAGDVVSIDAHRVRAVHRERAATTESRTDRRPASAPNTEQSSMRRSMRLLDLVHLKLGLSLMESRRAIQEGRVQVDATIIADIARFMDLDSTLTLLPRPQGVQTSELRIEHLELEFMVVWKPADMTVKDLEALICLEYGHSEAISRIETFSSGLVVIGRTPDMSRSLRSSLGEGCMGPEVQGVEGTCGWRTSAAEGTLCHYVFLVDCDTSMTTELRRAPHERIQELRPLKSSRWTRNRGQIQILECICFCPVPGTKLLTAILAELGYGLLGRNACSKAVGKKPLKCLIAWNFVDRQLEVRAPIPIAFTKTFDSQQEAWRRHWRVFRSLSNSAHVERFCGHGFLCDGVMIPRLGTEVIAEEAARQLSLATSSSPSLLDVGTGSGCIAIAALLGLPEDSKAFAVGLDKSATAVQIAQTNGRLLLPPQKTFIGLQLCFSQLQELATSADGFDVIVSNPPYLTRRQAQELGYATPVGPGEGRGRGTVEPIESFVLQRSAQVVAAVAACEERPGSLDGSVAVYGLLRAAIVKRRAKCPLLKQHGALVLEVGTSRAFSDDCSGVRSFPKDLGTK
ncbi:unnamed protein product [Durusdinium trenchii]|uniref:Methyltransferase domain-containing protein n=1 Tax=Durusdinium trenchii TaxID=1381693 RepID=A0ABP0IM93_9DINO